MTTTEVPDGAGSPLARAWLFVAHTLIVYTLALHISGWLVSQWFAWFAPLLQTSASVPPVDWYLQHFELVTILPAFFAGFFNLVRFAIAWRVGPENTAQSDSVAVWAWTIPVLVLCYKMLVYRAPNSSVLDERSIYEATMSTVKYFFVIQREVPRLVQNSFSVDPVRSVAQMFVTAPFYAGVAYSLGAFSAKYAVFTKLRHFESLEASEGPKPVPSEATKNN